MTNEPEEACAWCGGARPAASGKCPNCGGPRMTIDRKGALFIDLETTGLTSRPKPRPPISETR